MAWSAHARGLPRWATGLLLPLAVLAAWQLMADRGMLPLYMVAPGAILRAVRDMLLSGELITHAKASLFRAGMGFLIGASAGILVGLAAGVFAGVEGFVEPLVSLTYPIPKVALLPIIFAAFGLGDASKVFVISCSVGYPTYIAAFYGARSVKPLHIWSARNVGAGRWCIFRRIVTPSALPQIFAGLRIGLGLSFIVMVAAEFVTAETGLGYLIAAAEDSENYKLMYVAVVAIGVIGFAADRLLLLIRGRLLVGQLEATDHG